jgi:hypothetical protein
LDRYKHPDKKIFEIFSSISWGLSTGTKVEILNFYPPNFLNSPLVPVLSPQEIDEKISKKSFFGYSVGPNTLFLDLSNFLKIFWHHLIPITTSKKNLQAKLW